MAKYSVEITDANFDELVLNSDKPVILDFWAQWCGPCLAIGPLVEEMAQEYEGKIVVGKMDVDSNTRVPSQYGIMNIPTIIYFNKGEVVDKQIGASPADLKQKAANLLAHA